MTTRFCSVSLSVTEFCPRAAGQTNKDIFLKFGMNIHFHKALWHRFTKFWYHVFEGHFWGLKVFKGGTFGHKKIPSALNFEKSQKLERVDSCSQIFQLSSLKISRPSDYICESYLTFREKFHAQSWRGWLL